MSDGDILARISGVLRIIDDANSGKWIDGGSMQLARTVYASYSTDVRALVAEHERLRFTVGYLEAERDNANERIKVLEERVAELEAERKPLMALMGEFVAFYDEHYRVGRFLHSHATAVFNSIAFRMRQALEKNGGEEFLPSDPMGANECHI